MYLRKKLWIVLIFCFVSFFCVSNTFVVHGENAQLQDIVTETPADTGEKQETFIVEDSEDGVGMIEKHNALIKAGAIEVSSKRTGNSVNYELADGRKAMLLSSMPITYQDSSGKNQFIENNLVRDFSEDGYDFKNKANAFSVFFPEQVNRQTDILLRSQKGVETHLWNQSELWYEDANGERVFITQASERTGNVDENSIIYPERYQGISEIFSVRYAGIKHSFEMTQLPEFLSDHHNGYLAFQETMVLPEGTQILVDGELQVGDFTTDMEIVFTDPAGDFFGKIPIAWAHENTREEYDPVKDAKIFLTYDIQFVNDHTIIVSVQVPAEWLNEEGRIYPVTIDPSFNIYQYDGTYDGFQHTSEYFDASLDYLAVGYSSTLGYPYPFTHITFHDVNIPKGSKIDYVELNYKVFENATNLCAFEWRFEDSDNSNTIMYGPLVAERHYVAHYNKNLSYSAAWTVDEWRNVGDFSLGLQDVINRPGWVQGNNVSLAWAPAGAVGGWRKIYSYDGDYGPYLYVTYSPEDNYEENDSLATAQDIWAAETLWLSTLNGYGFQWDDDWYRIYVQDGYRRILVDARFTHSEGDIDIGLYNSSGDLLDSSTSTSDNEYIDFTATSGDDYFYIKVYYGNAGNQYDLWWDDVAPDDNYEENDTIAAATIINDDSWRLYYIDGYGVQADNDWYQIYVSPGHERIVIDAVFANSEGDIDIGLYNLSGFLLDKSETTNDQEHIDYTVQFDDAYYYIKVYGENASNIYDLMWHDTEPCYTLSTAHTGSGMNPVTDPYKSEVCTTGHTFVAGEYIQLGAVPDVGWKVHSWVGTNDNGSTSTTNYLTMPDENHTVIVNYITDAFNTYIPIVIKN